MDTHKGPEYQPDPTYITDCLRLQATSHVERNPGLVLLDDDPALYPDQAISATYTDSTALPIHEFITAATTIYPLFPDMLRQLDAHDQLLSDIGDAVTAGGNVIAATNHNHLSDIAYALGAYRALLGLRGYEFQTSTIVGKMVTHLGVVLDGNIVPLTDTLRIGCDRIYFNLPNTPSTFNAGIPEKYATAHNLRMARVLLSSLRAGHQLLGIAPTASTSIMEIEPSTVSLLEHRGVQVAPTAIWIRDGIGFIKPVGGLITVQNDSDVQAFVEQIKQGLLSHSDVAQSYLRATTTRAA